MDDHLRLRDPAGLLEHPRLGLATTVREAHLVRHRDGRDLSILGTEAVALAQSNVEPGKTLIRPGEWAGFSPAVHGTMQDWMVEIGIQPTSLPPVIELLDLDASDAASVAAAAHEACHAWLYQRFPENNLYRDEAYTTGWPENGWPPISTAFSSTLLARPSL